MNSITRRSCLALGGAGLAACIWPRTKRNYAFDTLIRGAKLIDGTGATARVADLGICGDTIQAIGTLDAEQARTTIEARGLCLTPGFIDIHTHSDRDIFEYPDDESRIYQGVTTEVTGNCGTSAAPRPLEQSADGRWNDVESYFRALEVQRVATNQLLLLGQGTLREAVAGLENRSLSSTELQRVLLALERGLEQGAAGLSTGLEYTPGRYTPTEELLALAAVLARHDRLYASHIRNEEAGLLESIDEAIAIGVGSGARVQISHLKAAGRPNWSAQPTAIAKIESARARGIDVLFDVYPYTAYSTGLTIFLSDATREGGSEAILRRLADPQQRVQIRGELGPRITSDPGGYELIVIASTASADKSVIGRNLASIARDWAVDPAEALLRVLEQGNAEVSFVGHAMSEANVLQALQHPLAMVSSDGYAMAPRGKALEKRPHPRSYGSFARVLQHYVREQRALGLEQAVHKMSGMPAAQLRLKDRGTIAVGAKADVLLFDLGQVREQSSFENPHQLASGFSYVFVNGRAVIQAGRATGERPGRALRS